MFDTLVVSQDSELISTMQAACSKLGITADVCRRHEQATARLGNRKYYGIVVDDATSGASAELLSRVRQTLSTKSAVSIAVARGLTGNLVETMFVLAKPVPDDLAVRTFRAAHGTMLREYRRYFRQPLRVPILINTEAEQQLPATAVNVSQSGLAVELAESQLIRPHVSLWVRFPLLPGSDSVRLRGEVAWCTPAGRAGLRCRGVTPYDCKLLEDWLARRVLAQK